MRKGRLLLVLGIFIAVLPYFGVPHFWKNVLLTLSGLGAALMGYLIYQELKGGEKKTKAPDNFTENNGYIRTQPPSEQI